MKDRLFRVSMLVLASLLVVVSASAAKKSPVTFSFTPIAVNADGTYACDTTSCGTYTATGIPQVKRADFTELDMHIVWGGNDSNGVCLYASPNTCAGSGTPVTTLTGYIGNSMYGYGSVCAQVTPEVDYYSNGLLIRQYSGETITVCSSY